MQEKNSMLYPDELFIREVRKDKQEEKYSEKSVWKDLKKELKKNKFTFVCLCVIVFIMIAALLAPLSPYDPNALSAEHRLEGSSMLHWFGTDDYGRDYFTRILYGGRISLTVGVCAMIVTVCVGTTIGVLSGYIGGKVDVLFMRFTDIFLALPSMLLMIVLNTFLKPGLGTLICVLSLFEWAPVARITRAETMSLKERDFIAATKNLGSSDLRIIIFHILPNIIGPVIVSASLGVASAVLTESSLSYLGLGVQVPQASWGSMLQAAQKYILDKPMLAIYPGAMILVTVLSFNLFGDILRTVLEPRTDK